jgi:hypothetical protein
VVVGEDEELAILPDQAAERARGDVAMGDARAAGRRAHALRPRREGADRSRLHHVRGHPVQGGGHEVEGGELRGRQLARDGADDAERVRALAPRDLPADASGDYKAPGEQVVRVLAQDRARVIEVVGHGNLLGGGSTDGR